jgi:seryl-tRNA synthetase
MNHSNVELLLGHYTDALQASYYKPTEKDVLSDYLKAVDVLTIDYDKNTLTKQVAELAEKNEEQNYVIKGKLAAKEKEAEETKKEIQAVKAKLEAYKRDDETNKQTLQAIAEQIREGERLQQERENLMMDLVRGIWENKNQLGDQNTARQIGSVIAEFEKEMMTSRLEGTRGKKKKLL